MVSGIPACREFPTPRDVAQHICVVIKWTKSSCCPATALEEDAFESIIELNKIYCQNVQFCSDQHYAEFCALSLAQALNSLCRTASDEQQCHTDVVTANCNCQRSSPVAFSVRICAMFKQQFGYCITTIPCTCVQG